MVIYLSLLVAVIGFLMVWLGTEPWRDIGRIFLFSGCLAFLLQIGGHQVGALR